MFSEKKKTLASFLHSDSVNYQNVHQPFSKTLVCDASCNINLIYFERFNHFKAIRILSIYAYEKTLKYYLNIKVL